MPHSLAGRGTPIFLNNACGSWHRLAETFTFGNARAYVGTLFMVSTSEAHDVVVKLLGKHFGKPLAVALWLAQNEVYTDGVRRPYVLTGVHPQRLRSVKRDVPHHIVQALARDFREWSERLRSTNPTDERMVRDIRDHVGYLEHEMNAIYDRWIRQ
jgi:hypothetical protein